jgi:hypothetical protein
MVAGNLCDCVWNTRKSRNEFFNDCLRIELYFVRLEISYPLKSLFLCDHVCVCLLSVKIDFLYIIFSWIDIFSLCKSRIKFDFFLVIFYEFYFLLFFGYKSFTTICLLSVSCCCILLLHFNRAALLLSLSTLFSSKLTNFFLSSTFFSSLVLFFFYKYVCMATS